MSTRLRATAASTVLVGAATLLAGCSATAEPTGVQVLASFYPLQYVVEQVGGDLVNVTSMTPPGAEPHDIELSPRQVRDVGDADVVVYLSGFQAAVDAAVTSRAPAHLVDAAQVPSIAEHMTAEESGAGDGTADDAHANESGDPHFWLDPTLLAALAPQVAGALTAADPDNTAQYAAAAGRLVADLDALDGEFTDGLGQCERRVVVTAHAAFGYLAERYDLTQVGLSGLDPEAEPSPSRLREIRDVVEQYGVTTVFTEALVSPKVAETLAGDLGISTAVLDPVESQVDEATDYRGAMEQNLSALRAALGCA